MRELGLDLASLKKILVEDDDLTFVLIRVPTSNAAAWATTLSEPVRRCYLSDANLTANATRIGRPLSEIIAAKIPDPGSVMAGDFGEILTAILLAAEAHPLDVRDPKKWRLKQDRTKPAPYSDVVQFVLPEWPMPSTRDRLVCAEVKTKSTAGRSTPVASAIADSLRDREGRLIKTLVWLKERALGEDLGTVRLDHIERFVKATDHPPATREFRAVAVICSSLLDAELAGIGEGTRDGYTLVVISVPDLKRNYESLYTAIVTNAEAETVDR